MLNATRCFWTERTVSPGGVITWSGRRYRVIQPGLEGRRVTVVETRDGSLLFEYGDQTYVAAIILFSDLYTPAAPGPFDGRAA